MKNLVVKINPATVSANFDELKAYLTVEVAKYDVSVEIDTVQDAKKLATELNAVTTGINKVKKDQLAILTAPADKFKDQIAELNKIVQDGRTKILVQVKNFEDRTRETIQDLLRDLLLEEYDVQELGDEYKNITVDDLILLGSLTKGGNLTKSASDEVKYRVASAKALEKEVELRLLHLSNECFIAGLKVPLSPEYIKDFLKADGDEYFFRLKELIAIELGRQEKAEEKVIADAKAESDRLLAEANRQRDAKIKAETQVKELKEQAKAPVKAPKHTKPIAEAPEGKKTLRIAIDFDIIVRENAPEEKVKAKMRQLLENAGIPTLNSITVEG